MILLQFIIIFGTSIIESGADHLLKQHTPSTAMTVKIILLVLKGTDNISCLSLRQTQPLAKHITAHKDSAILNIMFNIVGNEKSQIIDKTEPYFIIFSMLIILTFFFLLIIITPQLL